MIKLLPNSKKLIVTSKYELEANRTRRCTWITFPSAARVTSTNFSADRNEPKHDKRDG